MHGYSSPDSLINSCDMDHQTLSCNASLHTKAGLIVAASHHANDEYRQSPYDLISTAKSIDRRSVDDSEKQSIASVRKGSTMPGVSVAESDLAAMREQEREENNAPYKIQRRMDKSRLPPPIRDQQRPRGDAIPGANLPGHEVHLSHQKALTQVKDLVKQADYQNLHVQLLHNLQLQNRARSSGILLEVLRHQTIASYQREKWIYNLQPHERFVCRATVCHLC